VRARAALAVAALAGSLLSACGDGGNEFEVTITGTTPAVSGAPEPSAPPVPSDELTDEPTDPQSTAAPTGRPEVVGTIATGLEAPWGLDFLPDGDAVVTERDTRRVLRIGAAGEVTVLGVVEAAAPDGGAAENGLLGVAVSPTFDDDGFLYLYYSTADDNRVARAVLDGDRLGEPEVILDGIPRGTIHDGGRLEFGPDGMLYVSTGEAGEPSLAADRDSLGGKILRVRPDGRPAPGNPFDSPVWSYGHRNVQGLAFDDAGRLWASEFGDQAFDELNRIEAGSDYGWPEVEGTGGAPTYVDPQQTWNTDEASPSGLAHLGGTLWMAALRGEQLWRITLDGRRAVRPKGFFVGRYGRMRTVAAAPDGTLWVTTSNRDGRGDPADGDDRILQVRP
jgi:glucose/arabinose dehydrogenase